MNDQRGEGIVSEKRRREIFLALVEYQDHDLSVRESREMIGNRFDLTAKQVLGIEREGIANHWPPL